MPEGFDGLVEWFDRLVGVAWYREMLADCRALLGDLAGKRLLDVGCGTGLVSLELAAEGAGVTGVDLSVPMVERARRHAAVRGVERASFLVADACRLPFPDASFERVLAVCLLFWLPAPARGLAEMARVTVPGGRVVLANPSPRLMEDGASRGFSARRGLAGFDLDAWRGWTSAARQHRPLDEKETRAALVAAGLAEVTLQEALDGLALLASGIRP